MPWPLKILVAVAVSAGLVVGAILLLSWALADENEEDE